MKKELIIALDEAEKEITAVINNIMQKHGLPCYLFEPILGKIHRQLIDGKVRELESAKSRLAEKKEVANENNE